MNPDLEGVGGLVSAGLAAHAIDDISLPHRAGTAAHGHCGNCGAQLNETYCGVCGQAGHLHRSLLHLGEEFLHGVLHFDTKGFHTLPLLVVRPGLLTRRYIDGQRTRYVSPLALFLFCTFLMYFVFSIVSDHPFDHAKVRVEDAATAKSEIEKARVEAEAELATAAAALQTARQKGVGVKEAEDELAVASLSRNIESLSLHAADAALAREASAGAGSAPSWQDKVSAYAKAHADASGRNGKWMRALGNPDLMLYKLKSTAYKLSFLLIPISLPFQWLLFAWRRDIAVYDHAVFSLYSLSFMSLLFTAAALLSLTGWAQGVALCVIFIPPIHMFLQLRETYGLGILSALWRTFALLCVCGTVFLLFVLLILLVTVR